MIEARSKDSEIRTEVAKYLKSTTNLAHTGLQRRTQFFSVGLMGHNRKRREAFKNKNNKTYGLEKNEFWDF